MDKTISNFADMVGMRKSIMIFLPLLLLASSPFESPKPNSFNLKVFETKESTENKQAKKNPKVRCREVCDKKIYTEQKIADAVEFYKNSTDYQFKISR